MLIEFTVKNFRSFKDEARLTMLPEKKIKDNSEFLIETGVAQVPLLQKIAVIYGANASGKSNLLKAMGTMRYMVINSARTIKDEKIKVDPFKLSSKTSQEPTSFSVQFIAQGVRYHYGFAYNAERITDEFLDAYPLGKKQTWFERHWQEGKYTFDKFNKKILGDKDITNRTRDNILLLSKAIDEDNKILLPVWEWFKNLFITDSVSQYKTAELCNNNIEKNKILEFIQNADILIGDIKITYKNILDDFKESNSDTSSVKILKEVSIDIIKKAQDSNLGDINIPKVEFLRKSTDNDDFISFDLNQESAGTKQLFSLASLWITATEKQTPLIYDELDLQLHPNLQEYLINKFARNTESNAQLIFTSHNSNIMKNKLLRRDQFWFTELNREKSTELYPLTAIKERNSPRKGENIESKYLEGRLGAVPYLPQED